MPWERTLKLAGLYQLATLALLFALALWRWPAHAVPVLTAGLLMGGNFFLLRFLTERVFAAQRGRLVYGMLLIVKLGLVMAALAALVTLLHWHPLAIGAGMSTLIVGFLLGTFHVATAQPAAR